MKLIYGILIASILGSAKTTIQDLESELQKKNVLLESNSCWVTTQIQVIRPIETSTKMDLLIDSMVIRDIKEFTCTDTEGYFIFEYEPLFFSGSLISIRKTTTDYMCVPKLVGYIEMINFIERDGNVYCVELGSSIDTARLVAQRSDKDDNCTYIPDYTTIQLYFENNKAFVHVMYDPVCQFTAEIDLDSVDLKITETGV